VQHTTERYLGIDVGAETIKVVELAREGETLAIRDRHIVDHFKDPEGALRTLLGKLGWDAVSSAAATGRASRMLRIPRVPTKAALSLGVGHLFPDHNPGTVVSIGSHGFSVLELRGGDIQLYRENSRCSQGTGNFLRQLVERFELTVEQASEMCAQVDNPAALSGRCPVILKTDMTHLANKGENRASIIAGLYDAVCENVQVLLKPRLSPPKVLLVGGVMRAERIRENFRRFLSSRDMTLVESDPEECLYLEALGAALHAAEHRDAVPALDELIGLTHEAVFEHVPPPTEALKMVTRMPRVQFPAHDESRRVVLGFDIGSTGSKVMAVDVEKHTPVWEGYVNTLGDPVGAARKLAGMFLTETGGRHVVLAVGATGSGREIVGSLMASCFGPEPVFVLNEIAAHAEGALHFDDRVDTIFEIGGQDAKYIRLDGGRICDAAMNEACSAGTGSFIAEQGGKFQGVEDVVHMGKIALEADFGVSLGQHCSVFMAEVIDEAVAAGVPRPPILAGIYDSIIQNYLNRVKGNRSVGQRIFCQGMPFMTDALAAAVARQTGRPVIVPPNPGTIGALGIGLLTLKEIDVGSRLPLDIGIFLGASVDKKTSFICKSTKGCGGSGNKCKIERLTTRVAGKKQKFTWGGNCSLFDAGTHRRKLPDLAPDPFRERHALIEDVIESTCTSTGRKTVLMTDEFALKGLLPFFATFVTRLGFDVRVRTDAGQKLLKRGIENANVPFCAPMQIYQGAMAELLEEESDYVLAPRMRELPRQKNESHAVTCPIVQASPDIIRKGTDPDRAARILAPRIDMGPGNLRSDRFMDSTRALARMLGAEDQWEHAFAAARMAQLEFEAACRQIGRRSLDFCKEHDVLPIVVLGRAYTIYNTVLNSNVPNLLREQGAMAIPVDCYPLDDDTPVFNDLYWGYSQVNLRAAHQIRRTDGHYALFCSNYSCGPDSFNLHFFSYVMENKPFAIIETDGHSGDAGTKTRIEAFLYCVEGDTKRDQEERDALRRNNFKAIEADKISVGDVKRREELLIIPRMGPGAEVISEVFKGEGIRAETMPMATRDSLRLGRRYTSGKECVPMTITTGSLLERLERDRDTDERFAFLMPNASGPCRFGVYNVLHKILLEKTGWKDRVRIVTPSCHNYFADVSANFQVRALVGFVASDVLQGALHDVRPVETIPGRAQEIYDRYFQELKDLLREAQPGNLMSALAEIGNGMYGVRRLIERAAAEFSAVKDHTKDIPTVSVVGEIYVRLDPFANDFIVEKLEERGIRALLAPFGEWLEYTNYCARQRLEENMAVGDDSMTSVRLTQMLQSTVINRLYAVMKDRLDWSARTRVEDSVHAAQPYISRELKGEAVLTLGGPVHEHVEGIIDGVVSVGPHECMPNKISEAQFAVVGEEKGLISLTLPLNGDPIDSEILDRFAYEVKQRHQQTRKNAPKRAAVGMPAMTSFMQAFQDRAVIAALRLITPLAPGSGVGPSSMMAKVPNLVKIRRRPSPRA